MKVKLIVGALAFVPLLGFARSTITSSQKNRFCRQTNSASGAISKLSSSENRLSFLNQGGLLNGGVCWWHSRFVRNAAHVAIFAPDQYPPTESEAKKIIKDIRMGRQIVVVPGFSNLREFSRVHGDLILQRLEKWQIGDGLLRQQWTVGLWGKTETTAEKLEERMDELYNEVEVKKRLTYQMLQIKGIDSHAWLVLSVDKTYSGYQVTVLDSNFSSPRTYSYRKGDTSFYSRHYGNFIGITGKKREVKRLKKIVSKFCD